LFDCGRKRVGANHGSGVAAFYLLGFGLASTAVDGSFHRGGIVRSGAFERSRRRFAGKGQTGM
jgi:hypothetical protein